MDFYISHSSNKPIYEQIMAQIKSQILSGVLKEGDALPSIRVLAREYHSDEIINISNEILEEL